MNENDISKIQNWLNSPKKIAIIPHRNPDGDAMGSTLGLSLFLKKLNHEVVVIAPNEFPENLAWLPESNKVLIYEKNKAETTTILENSELIFTLDFNAFHRTGEMEKVLEKLTVPFIMIDHHQSPDDFAEVTFSDTKYGSTCEMVFHFIEAINQKKRIDKEIATCLYTGILTDSGSFRFPKTTGTTHRIIAEFIDLGVENTKIPNLLFDNSSYESLQLLGVALQNMKVIPSKKTAFITLTQEELKKHKYKKGDTEGFVNYGLTIKGINFAAIFIENLPEENQENLIKISFRSQGDFDVNQFARENFEGGGHINAAGGKSSLNMNETISKFEKLLETITI